MRALLGPASGTLGMFKYIVKKFAYGFLVLFGVVNVVFFIFHALPGDPVSVILGAKTGDKETRAALVKDLGLDKPLLVQLGRYLNELSPLAIHADTPESLKKYQYSKVLDLGETALVVKRPYLGRSYETRKRVDEIIAENVVGTFWLAVAAITFATVLGIIFGLVAALNKDSFWDHFLVSISVLGISAPSFVSATLIAMIFGFYLSDYTGLNLTGTLWDYTFEGNAVLQLHNLILPAFTLGIRPLAIITQLTRSSMLDVISQDYIRTAKAKGLSQVPIIFKHALKNALNPVITAVSNWLASLLSGAIFVEVIFNWKGLGSKIIHAVMMLDFPVVMGCTIFVGFVFVIITIAVDILYAVVDPRVKLN